MVDIIASQCVLLILFGKLLLKWYWSYIWQTQECYYNKKNLRKNTRTHWVSPNSTGNRNTLHYGSDTRFQESTVCLNQGP